MACIYCYKPVLDNEPMHCCLNCHWLETVRKISMDELFFYMEEQESLVKKLKEVRKRIKEAEEQYERAWDEVEKSRIS